MNPLDAKKRALVAESEVFRETMKLELHNLRIYGVRTRQKLNNFARPNKLLLLAAPFAGLLFRKKRTSLTRRFVLSLLGYQLTNRFLPILSAMFTDKRAEDTSCAEEPAQHTTR